MDVAPYEPYGPAEPIGSGLTYDDLVALPEDNLRHELIDGEHFVTPAPRIEHQDVVIALTRALADWCDDHGAKLLIAPTDVLFSQSTVLEPDLLVLLDPERMAGEGRYVPVAPDLVVEVSSPSTRGRDRLLKRRVFEENGVREFWFVDLDHRLVEVYAATEPGGRYGPPTVVDDGPVASVVLAGFTIALDRLLG